MVQVSRKINWVSSLRGNEKLSGLQKSLEQFYSSNNLYFDDIDFTVNNWIGDDADAYQKIVELAKQNNTICEVGCGAANILKHYPAFHSKYTGLDFSEKLLDANSKKYPAAQFYSFKTPNVFPVNDESFDFVFCVFVLEHVIYPAAFLDECRRILKPGGSLVILCPDFLGKGRMTSQRAGYSQGTAREKLKQNKFFDAAVTLFDNRIRIPLLCRFYARKAAQYPLFLINCSPTLFQDTFQFDADAVYVTYKPEIIKYLSKDFIEISNEGSIKEQEIIKKAIFLQMKKKLPG